MYNESMEIREDFTRRPRLGDLGRWYITRFVATTAAGMREGARVLDAGAGEGAYRRFFDHCRYEAADLAVGEQEWNYGNLDYVAPLHDLPIENETFDAVLCTQVLEHLELPRESVRELYRVLKPGGKLFLTAPMAHPLHQEPYDFFRYTSHGLRSICADAGFTEIEIEPFGGLFVRWSYELPRATAIFPPAGLRNGKPSLRGIALLPLRLATSAAIRIVQFGLLQLDRFDHQKRDPFGWSVVATK
jgi:ubiquinone/menaquinone biosynthesis C-methylase UbiE